jgi:beta-galactosidase
LDDVGVEVVSSFASGFAAGSPAITVNRGSRGGAAWYVGTRPSTALLDELVTAWLSDSGVSAAFDDAFPGAETVLRGGRRFVANHAGTPVELRIDGRRIDLPGYGCTWIGAHDEPIGAQAQAEG